MFSKVDIRGEPPEYAILIRRNVSRVSGAAFFCFPILWAGVATFECGGVGLWENLWMTLPFLLFAAYENAGIYWGVQRILVSREHVQFESVLGTMSLDSRTIDLARIECAEIREEWRHKKGGKYLYRRIVFLSGEEVLEETANLSRVDAWRLLYGPFQSLIRAPMADDAPEKAIDECERARDATTNDEK